MCRQQLYGWFRLDQRRIDTIDARPGDQANEQAHVVLLVCLTDGGRPLAVRLWFCFCWSMTDTRVAAVEGY